MVKNPDGERAFAPEPFWIDDIPSEKEPEIDDVIPDGAPNTGRITLIIQGSNFDSGAEVTLTKANASPIKGTNTTFSEDGKEMQATFNLKNKEAGDWDVQVTNPNQDVSNLWEPFAISLPPTIDSAIVTTIQSGNRISTNSGTVRQ